MLLGAGKLERQVEFQRMETQQLLQQLILLIRQVAFQFYNILEMIRQEQN